MRIPENIFLVGSMGAGKSTIGKQLAKSLRKDFVDSDHEIESRTGVDIGYIFDLEGEEGFRKRERQAIEDLTQKRDIVLATGGGAVLSAENRSNLVARGFVVYLYAPLDLLVERASRDRGSRSKLASSKGRATTAKQGSSFRTVGAGPRRQDLNFNGRQEIAERAMKEQKLLLFQQKLQ